MTLGLSLPAMAAEAQRESLAVVDDAWNTLRQQARVEQLGQLMAEDFVLVNADGGGWLLVSSHASRIPPM